MERHTLTAAELDAFVTATGLSWRTVAKAAKGDAACLRAVAKKHGKKGTLRLPRVAVPVAA